MCFALRVEAGMRLGIFGGTFDPVHYGHLLLAEMCREQGRLDEVWFVPTAVSPLKQHRPPSEAKHRVEMLQLATGGHAAFRVSLVELERGGVSYTVDTLAHFRQQFPQAELFFLMGADSVQDFPQWREPVRICELALPLVVRRHGSPEPNFQPLAALLSTDRLAQVQANLVNMPVIELSSTQIRERVAANHSIRFQTPRAVEEYITFQGLYRGA
jgi:nicotinate-nucleotide adenylyltransferase